MRRTQVAVVGAGPAGLVLAHRLADAGIEALVIEARSRAHVESRVRAGVLEHPTVRLLADMGLDARMSREGLVHHGVNLQWDGQRHRIDFAELTGRYITVYGQQEVVKDLVAAWLDRGGELIFDAPVTAIEGAEQPPATAGTAAGTGLGTQPPAVVSYDGPGGTGAVAADVVAGCDGFHGVCRPSIPAGHLKTYERNHPFAWLGILAEVAPSTDELIYSFHQRGFAMHSLRSPSISRLYLQVAPEEDLSAWPDDRIWSELQQRLASPGWWLEEGPILEKGITPMRSFVTSPLRHGRLFLAGDAAHIVPPTGAKGLNLAVADVKVLSDALVAWFRHRDSTGLDRYSDTCLERVWRVQDFSTFMTELLHVHPGGDGFGQQLQRARQRYVATSRAMATSLAENYVGLPLPGPSWA